MILTNRAERLHTQNVTKHSYTQMFCEYLELSVLFLVKPSDTSGRADNAGKYFGRSGQNLFAPSKAEEIAFMRRRRLTAPQRVEHACEYTYDVMVCVCVVRLNDIVHITTHH